MSTSISAPSAQATNNICQTAECTATAESLLKYIDFNADPCSDFYQYTCGAWLKNATLPKDEFMVGPYLDAMNAVSEVLHGLLEGEYEDIYKNLKDGDAGFHTEDEQEIDKANFQNIKDYYNLCMDVTALDELGPTPIYPEVAKIQNSLFPANPNETYSADKVDQLTETLISLTRIKDTLISPAVYGDLKNSNESAIYMAAPALTLQSKEPYASNETLQIYNARLVELVSIVLGAPDSEIDGPKRIEASKNAGLELWSKEKVQSAVNNFIQIETAIANISLTTLQTRDNLTSYNPVPLKDFQQNHPMINYESLLKGLLVSGTALPERVLVSAPEYCTKLNQLLSSGINMVTLQDYFIIAYVTEFANALDTNTRTAYTRLTGELLTGKTVDKPRWRTCADATSKVYDSSLGRYYILRAFGSEAERNKTETFINTLHDSWRNRIKNTTWLDSETRERAMEKLNLIQHKVAYPTETPDVRSPSSLGEYYDGLTPNKTSYFDTEVKQKTWYKTLMWEQYGKPMDSDAWIMPPQTVNAYYNPATNDIVVPVGFLQPIFYDNNFPWFLNYGSVGYIVGHEINHAFDSNGRLFDGHGNVADWWTNTTSQEYVRRQQCFVDQYSKFNITGPDGKAYNVDGALTLSENIADNGGIAASYYAYQNLRPNHTQTEQRLPGLEQLSVEQLFFVNFGRTWCSLQSDQLNLVSLYTDTHSPSSARVNGVVQNSEEFSRAFHCPAGSPMNPQTKCKLW